MIYGYARVSSKDQKLERQVDAMIQYGVAEDNIFCEKKSGKNFEREEYLAVKEILREGDLLYIDSLDRIGRDYDGIIKEWKSITRDINADIVCLDNENIFDSRKFKSMGDYGKLFEDMILSAFAWGADQERKKMLERQKAGIEAAKRRGEYNPGRPSKRAEGYDIIKQQVERGEMGVMEAVRELGISKATWYNWLKETA